MIDHTVKQLYKLISSYQRAHQYDGHHMEAIARDAAEEATNKTFLLTQYRLSASGWKLLTGFAACAVMVVGCTGYGAWQARKTQTVMKEVMKGNPVIAVGNDYYAVLEEKGNSECHQFVVGKVLLWTNNNRPGFVDGEKTVRFRIPEGCKP